MYNRLIKREPSADGTPDESFNSEIYNNRYNRKIYKKYNAFRNIIPVVFIISVILILFSLQLMHTYIKTKTHNNFLQFSVDIKSKHNFNDYIPILVPICGRIEYLSQTLEYISNVNNINNTIVVISDDCFTKYPEIRDSLLLSYEHKLNIHYTTHIKPYFGLLSYLPFFKKYLTDNYASADNIYSLLKFAFEYLKVDNAILLESDIIPAPDLYDYFVWARDTITNNISHPLYNKIYTINGFIMSSPKDLDKIDLNSYYTLRYHGFTAWGWMGLRRLWKGVMKDAFPFRNWDFGMEKARNSSNLVSLTPFVTRTKNIGLKGLNFNENKDSKFYRMKLHNNIIGYNNVEPIIVKDSKILKD